MPQVIGSLRNNPMSGASHADYRRYLEAQRRSLLRMLKGGQASVRSLAIQRTFVGSLASELAHAGGSIVRYNLLAGNPFGGPAYWGRQWHERALDQYRPVGPAYDRKTREYLVYGERLIIRTARWRDEIYDRKNGIRYVQRAGPLLMKTVMAIARELFEYSNLRKGDSWYLNDSPRDGLVRMLSERIDLVAALRVSQSIGLLTRRDSIPIQRKPHEEFIETVVGFIPLVGNAVAAWEAYTGRDLFGYKLSTLERSILAGSVLLPAAGRLARGGKSLYTAKRLERLYGR